MDDATQAEIKALRRELEIIEERRRDDKAAVQAELAHINKIRGAMADQAARFVPRNEFEAELLSRIAPLQASVDAKLNERPDWGGLGIMVSLIIALGGALWWVSGLQIDSNVSPLRLQSEQARIQGASNAERLANVEKQTAGSVAADSESRSDRAQLNQRVHSLEAILPIAQTLAADVTNLKSQVEHVDQRGQELREAQTKQMASLVEVETQFCASDAFRNIMHAYDLRIQSTLWHKLIPDAPFPTDNAYYPRIGRCGTDSAGR